MRAIEEAFLKIGIAGAILLVMFKFGEIVLKIFGKDKNSQNNQINKVMEANQQQSKQLIEAIVSNNSKGMEEVKIQSTEIKNMAVAIGKLAIAITEKNKIEENNRNYIQEKFAGVDSKLEAIIKEINKISKDTAFINERTEFCMNGSGKNGNSSR